MERLGPVMRLSLGLVVLTSSLLVLADVVGLVPEPGDARLDSRLLVTETLATQLMPAAEKSDFRSIRELLDVTVARNPDLLSAGLRAQGGRLLVVSGEHRALWTPESAERSSPTHVRMPVFQSGREWGIVELRFEGLESPSVWAALWARPLVRLVLGVGAAGFIVYLIYMRRTLRHLDPSSVVPARVQNALDVMAEGVVLIDEKERIVLAIEVFAERLECTPKSLLGKRASSLGWKTSADEEPLDYPWLDAMRDGERTTGTPLRIHQREGKALSFAVNASPVLDGWDRPKGAIVTFDDVTLLEERTAALEAAYIELEKSRDEIHWHAQEMEMLAKRDPLTGIANRRSFMEWAEVELVKAHSQGSEFSLLMSDIDHFKRINDNYGHAMGDDVIKRVAQAFSSELRESDSVCRYGGEEFCVALPGASLEVAMEVAERLRVHIDTPDFAEVPVTMSFGAVSRRSGTCPLGELLDRADKALYASKEGGRNRATAWEDVAPARGTGS